MEGEGEKDGCTEDYSSCHCGDLLFINFEGAMHGASDGQIITPGTAQFAPQCKNSGL